MKLERNWILIVALVVCASLGGSLSAQTCSPPGWFVGAGGGYEYIANGQPLNANCWAMNFTIPLVSTPSCTYSTAQAFEMRYGARLSQTFAVPSTQIETHWDLSYLLTMQDPHDDGWWNRLKVTVYDVTAGRTIASQTYWGDDPDVTCVRRDLTFTGNYAGHTLQVIFADGSAYTDTIFRVRSVSLIQN